MSRHEGDVRLRHMLDHAREAVTMTRGSARTDLDIDRRLNLSLVRLLGSSVKRLPACHRNSVSSIPIYRGLRLSVCATA
jgi:hypothetical protein